MKKQSRTSSAYVHSQSLFSRKGVQKKTGGQSQQTFGLMFFYNLYMLIFTILLALKNLYMLQAKWIFCLD